MAEPELLLICETATDWEQWLSEHHASTPDGVWLEFGKKGSGLRRVTYPEAVDAALCWGWIDARAQGLDERRYKQRFLPRRPKSLWSKVNRLKVAALEAAGRMQAPGRAEVARAKADGRWDAAYDSPKTATVPPDLAKALSRAKQAKALFEQLDGTNRYAILHRLMVTAKPELRAKKIAKFVDELGRGVVPHPERLPKALRAEGVATSKRATTKPAAVTPARRRSTSGTRRSSPAAASQARRARPPAR